MGFISNTLLSASEALNPIKALASQAKSYGRPAARLGMRAAREVTNNALSHGLSKYVIGGAIAGGAAGGGMSYADGRSTGSTIRSTLKGAALGAIGGGALRMGMSAYGMRGGVTARGIGAGMARGKQAVSNAYRTQMLMAKLERAAGVTRGPSASFKAGRGFVMGQASAAMNSSAGGSVAAAAGRAVGAARGAYGWARGMAGDITSKYMDMGKYYTGLS